jgi:hypothetical protein
MKRLTYFGLIVMFVAANALLFVGCGCDDDDDDTADSAGRDAGEETQDTGVGGTSGSGGEDAGEQTEDTGVSGDDAAVDTGTEPEYACGGDNAECDLLDEDSCDEGEGCQFLMPSSGEGAPETLVTTKIYAVQVTTVTMVSVKSTVVTLVRQMSAPPIRLVSSIYKIKTARAPVCYYAMNAMTVIL